MGLLAPLALGFLPVMAAIAALYLLRFRRPETGVSSLYLWRALLQDREANAPWQRLSGSVLLLLQLLVAAALILALARPWAQVTPPGGRNLFLILDTSASMNSVDAPEGRTRLAEARRLAWNRIVQLPSNGTATIIAAANHANVIAPASSDRDFLRHALDSLAVLPVATDLAEALSLAAGLAAASPEPEILVYSDGRFPDARRSTPNINGPVHFVAVGTRGANQAIVALSLRRTAATLALFAQVLNAAETAVTRRIDVDLDGVAWAGRTLTLPPGETTPVLLDEVPAGTGVVHARLAGNDDLALDDEAWTVNRAADPAPVLLVTEGNRFLQNALSLLPNVNLSRSAPAEYAPSLTATLTVFDGIAPADTLPAGNLLFIAPPASTRLFDVNGKLTGPIPSPPSGGAGSGPVANSSPDLLLRYTDLTDLHIAESARLEGAAWARTVLDSESGPLIVAGETEGRRVVVIGFDLHNSDLPLQMTFPLLMRNIVGYLLPEAAGGLPVSVAAGVAVPVAPDAQSGVTHVSVAGPGGAALADYSVDATHQQFSFGRTASLGLYVVSQWIGTQEVRREGFTVNLFSPAESQTAPRKLPPLPVGRSTPAPAGSEGARFEWWQGAAILALIVLVTEWLASHRLGLRRFGQRLGIDWRGQRVGSP